MKIYRETRKIPVVFKSISFEARDLSSGSAPYKSCDLRQSYLTYLSFSFFICEMR